MDNTMETLATRLPAADVSELTTRRDLVQRLAALGLVTAGGTVLEPLDAAAKDGPRGNSGHKNRRRKRDNQQHSKKRKKESRGHKTGGGDASGPDPSGESGPEHASRPAETSGADTKRGKRRSDEGGKGQGDGIQTRLNLPDLPDPRVSATLTIGRLNNLDAYPVTVSGTISFDPELIALMQRGRQFGLTCELWGLDFGVLEPRARAFIPLAPGSTGTFTATGSRSFKFSDQVGRSKLNEDTTIGDADEIVARLKVWTRRTSSSTWRAATLAGGTSYIRSNTVVRVL